MDQAIRALSYTPLEYQSDLGLHCMYNFDSKKLYHGQLKI